MKRTPALVAAAAALGLLAGLGLEARASALTGEVSPHMVAMTWLTPGAPSPAGLEMEGPGGLIPSGPQRLPRLPAMRARASERVKQEITTQRHTQRKVVSHGGGCPREQAERAEQAAAFRIHRS